MAYKGYIKLDFFSAASKTGEGAEPEGKLKIDPLEIIELLKPYKDIIEPHDAEEFGYYNGFDSKHIIEPPHLYESDYPEHGFEKIAWPAIPTKISKEPFRATIKQPIHTPAIEPVTANDNDIAEAAEEQKNPHAELFTLEVTRSFNTAAGHIEGHLVPMTAEEVQGLHNKFKANIDAQVDLALKDIEASDELRAALTDYAIALSRTRQKPKAKMLKEIATKPIDKIKELTQEKLADLAEVDTNVEKYLKEYEHHERSGADPAAAMFKEQDRAYFRLEDKSVSSVEPFVRVFLEKQGYEITDYKAGLASNDGGKNNIKIGKLFRKHDAPEGLVEAYNNDPCRVQKNLMVVLTRNPTDISRGSHARGWQSCRASAGSAASNGVNEYYAGVVGAYLVTEDDPDIHDPLGRLYMKPFDSEVSDSVLNAEKNRYEYKNPVGPIVYFTFNPIGLHFPAFVDAVNRFADEKFNKDKHGLFYMRGGCESYRELTERHRLPEDAEAALKQLGIPYTKNR